MQLSSSVSLSFMNPRLSSACLRERDSEPLRCGSFEKNDIQEGQASFKARLSTHAQFLDLPAPPRDEGLHSLKMLHLSTSNVAEMPV